MQKLQGWVEAGNTTLTITGAAGAISRKVQGSYPSATVTVYLNDPPAIAISSIARASNVVTVTIATGHGFIAGESVTIAGVTDSGFNGTFTILTSGATTITYAQTAANASSSGGTADSSLRLATIYADDAASPTSKANPFTASTDGTWFFYAANNSYDVKFSGGAILTPFTIGDLSLGVGNAGVPSYATADLPTPKTQDAGNLARLTDSIMGLLMSSGTAWAPVLPVANATNFAGADWVAKVHAAQSELPSTGGVIDMRSLTGSQTSSTTLSLTKPVLLLLPTGTLTSTAASKMFNLSSSGIHFRGSGKGDSILQYNPPGSGTCIHAENPGSPLTDCSFRDFTIDGLGNTQTKTGMDLIDMNELTIWNVSTANWTSSGNDAYGIRIRGRQSINLKNVRLYTNRPLRLSTSPNGTVLGASFDNSHFEDLYLTSVNAAGAALGTQKLIEVDSDVFPTQMTFDGEQAWVAGKYGFYWSGFTHASLNAKGISFNNVKWEQGPGIGSGGYIFYIDPIRQTFGVEINKVTTDNTNNFSYVRNCKNIIYRANVFESLGIIINGDNTSNSVEIGNLWNQTAGATFSTGNMRRLVVGSDTPTSSSDILPIIDLIDPATAGAAVSVAQFKVNGGQIGEFARGESFGNSYVLTAPTRAAVVFGGGGATQPSITLVSKGVYLIYAQLAIEYVGATFAAARTVSLMLRRTNNTAADLITAVTFITGIVTTVTQDAMCVTFPLLPYATANTNDVLTIYAGIDVVPSAGTIEIRQASIFAWRIY